MLLSPAENVVVIVRNALLPPQHASGNGVPGKPKLVSGRSFAVMWFSLTGVTSPSTVTESAMLSPFVSQLSVAVVDTILPGRSTGTPPSGGTPGQICVISFGKKPQP